MICNSFNDRNNHTIFALFIGTLKGNSLESIVIWITLEGKALHRCELADAELVTNYWYSVGISSHVGFKCGADVPLTSRNSAVINSANPRLIDNFRIKLLKISAA